MKSNLFTVVLLLISSLSFSQNSKSAKIFLDSLGNKTTEENHKYYRIVKDYFSDQKSYEVSEYSKSGVLQMRGTTTNKDNLNKEGQFIYYYENGKKKNISFYTKNKLTGKQINLYENGKPKSEIEYIETPKSPNLLLDFKINQYWDADGVQKVIDGNGEYEYTDKFHSESGKIKDGFYDGVWKGKNINPSYSYTEIYENGKFISGVSIDKNSENHTYTEVFTQPKPKNGMADFYKFIGKNYSTPNVQGLKGKIYVRFIVEKDGKIVEPKVIKDIGYGTGEEAIRVITDYENWIPGQQRGIDARVNYIIPINIQSPY